MCGVTLYDSIYNILEVKNVNLGMSVSHWSVLSPVCRVLRKLAGGHIVGFLEKYCRTHKKDNGMVGICSVVMFGHKNLATSHTEYKNHFVLMLGCALDGYFNHVVNFA